jgi:hypothetical protein
MATAVAERDPTTHPLALFLKSYQASRDLLIREQIEQEGVASDGNADPGARADANAAVLDLTSAIAQLDSARTTFLVRVFTGVIAPSLDLVQKTAQLNADLASETVKANLAGVYVQIVAAYLNGATQVISGNVPAADSDG